MASDYDQARLYAINPKILEDLHTQVRNADKLPMTKLVNQVMSEDAVAMLEIVPDESIDMVFCDEPYGVRGGILHFYAQDRVVETHFDWDNALPAHLTMPWVYHAARVLKPGGVLINFGMASWATTFEAICIDAGLTFRAHVVWFKPNSPPRLRKGGWRSSFEELWSASKGSLRNRQKRLAQEQLLNVEWEVPCPNCGHSVQASRTDSLEVGPYPHHTNRSHPTQKPEWLIAKYVHMLSEPGEIILDPFCGSGVIPYVAAQMSRHYIANDRDLSNKDNPAHWAEFTRLRLESLQLRLD